MHYNIRTAKPANKHTRRAHQFLFSTFLPGGSSVADKGRALCICELHVDAKMPAPRADVDGVVERAAGQTHTSELDEHVGGSLCDDGGVKCHVNVGERVL